MHRKCAACESKGPGFESSSSVEFDVSGIVLQKGTGLGSHSQNTRKSPQGKKAFPESLADLTVGKCLFTSGRFSTK